MLSVRAVPSPPTFKRKDAEAGDTDAGLSCREVAKVLRPRFQTITAKNIR